MIIKQAICLSDEQTGLEIKAALEQIAAVRLQNAADIQTLSGFITSERDMHSMDFLIIDLRAQKFSTIHIISAMQMMKRFCKAEPIFIVPKCAESDILIGKLAEINIKSCVAADAETDAAAEVLKCVKGERRHSVAEMQTVMQNAMQERMRKEVSPQLEIPQNAALTIAVIGAMERIGATTQAIGIYHYLKRLGFAPLFVDRTQNRIEMYARMYPEKTVEKENALEVNGVNFGADILVGTPFNAFIYEPDDANDDGIQPHFTVLVGGSKEWEFMKLADKLQKYDGSEHLKIILSFSEESYAREISNELGTDVYAAPYMPDFWHNDNGKTADFLVRYIELRGAADSNTYAEFERLKKASGLNCAMTVTADNPSKIQFGEEFTVTLISKAKIGLGGVISAPVTVKSAAYGRSEKYWK